MDEELFDHSLHRESNEWTKDTLSGLGACKGVLLFTHADGQPIQLLQAASIRRTAQAKLLEEIHRSVGVRACKFQQGEIMHAHAGIVGPGNGLIGSA